MKLTELQQYLIPAVALLHQPKSYIPFSLPSLNIITGGGIPVGMMTDLVGAQGTGKTSLSLDAIAQAQKCDHATFYVDQERTFDPAYAQSLGVDLERLTIIRAGAMEETLTAIEWVFRQHERAFVVLDSVTWLIPSSASDDNPSDIYETEQRIGEHAKKLGLFCKRLTPILALRNNTLLFINQYRANISTLSRVDKKPAGSFVYHHALSLRLELVTLKKGDDADEVQVTVTKNRTAPARRSATVKLVHGRGFDAGADVLQHAIRLGLIEKRGSWYVSPRTGEKVQGEIVAISTFCTSDLVRDVMTLMREESDNDAMG
jgi:recombination protein RecA